MKIHLILLSLGIVGASAFAGKNDKIQKLFVQRCATCHNVPDPAIRSDMAWLDQVNRTS